MTVGGAVPGVAVAKIVRLGAVSVQSNRSSWGCRARHGPSRDRSRFISTITVAVIVMFIRAFIGLEDLMATLIVMVVIAIVAIVVVLVMVMGWHRTLWRWIWQR